MGRCKQRARRSTPTECGAKPRLRWPLAVSLHPPAPSTARRRPRPRPAPAAREVAAPGDNGAPPRACAVPARPPQTRCDHPQPRPRRSRERSANGQPQHASALPVPQPRAPAQRRVALRRGSGRLSTYERQKTAAKRRPCTPSSSRTTAASADRLRLYRPGVPQRRSGRARCATATPAGSQVEASDVREAAADRQPPAEPHRRVDPAEHPAAALDLVCSLYPAPRPRTVVGPHLTACFDPVSSSRPWQPHTSSEPRGGRRCSRPGRQAAAPRPEQPGALDRGDHVPAAAVADLVRELHRHRVH